MANIPDHLFYSKDHEWVEVNEDVATIGITDFAQHSLGDVVYVELPKEGDTFAYSGAARRSGLASRLPLASEAIGL